MLRDIEEDIHTVDNLYAYLTLFSNTLRIGIIGGGRGGYIKAKTFVERGAFVEVLALEICEDILVLKNNYDNITVKEGEYCSSFINDKHLVIIAINDCNVIKDIIDDCNKYYKIYINSSDYINGMGIIPFQRETESVVFGVNSKSGNPKGTIFIGNKIKETIQEYDEFLKYISKKRKWLKTNKNRENEKKYSDLLTFINSEEFFYFYNKGYGEQIIDLFLQD